MRFALLCCSVVITACRVPGAADPSVVVPCTDLGGGFGDAGSLTVEEYCAALIPSTCARYTACGLTETSEGCMTVLERSLAARERGGLPGCEALKAGLTQGRISFDCKAAADCLAPTSNCTGPTSCDHLVAGLVPLDGACSSDPECVKGTWCHGARSTCPGRCARRLDENEASGNALCREDLVRVPASFGTVKTFRCINRAGLGGRCNNGWPTSDMCVPGLLCNTAIDACEMPHLLNEPCPRLEEGRQWDSVCSSGLFCQNDGSGQSVCRPFPALGQSCGGCRLDLLCIGNVCESLRTQGEACMQPTECGPGLYCAVPAVGSTGECRQPADELDSFCVPGSCVAGLRCGRVVTSEGFEYRCVSKDVQPPVMCP